MHRSGGGGGGGEGGRGNKNFCHSHNSEAFCTSVVGLYQQHELSMSKIVIQKCKLVVWLILVPFSIDVYTFLSLVSYLSGYKNDDYRSVIFRILGFSVCTLKLWLRALEVKKVCISLSNFCLRSAIISDVVEIFCSLLKCILLSTKLEKHCQE